MTMLLLAGCKQDKVDSEVSLKGKWTIQNTIINEYVNGRLEDRYSEPGDGTTLDFRENGKVVIAAPGLAVESLPYIIRPNSKVEIDGDVYEIRDLARATVKLFIRQDYAAGEYDEVLLNLKR